METAVDTSQTVRKGRRLIELDILRGFLLLWMTLTHLQTKVSIISNQTFGFVSGAEGFIFLAGFMMGQVENRVEERRGVPGTHRDLLKRTARVYFYHLCLVAIAFSVFGYIAVLDGDPSLHNLLSFFFASPKKAVIAAALLIYRPSLLDILPMYVVFLLLTAGARAAARRWSWDAVVYPSFVLWACAQFGLRSWTYRHVDLFGLGVPENSTGAFDMYAWQLLWMVGLALGSLYNAPQSMRASDSPIVNEEAALPAWLIRLSIVVASVLLILRYSPVDRWMDGNVYGWLIDKWHLGPVRVLNFSAVTVVLVRFGHAIGSLRFLQPLALLGQASLEVFSAHVVCCFIGDALSPDADPQLSVLTQTILLTGTIAVLFAVAYGHRVWVARRKEPNQAAPLRAA